MKTVEIIQREDYHPAQQKLVDIFTEHAKGCMPEFPVIFKAPRTRKQRTYINRIPCRTVGGQGDYHLVAMEVVDFVRLMVKSGIEVKIYDAPEAPHE